MRKSILLLCGVLIMTVACLQAPEGDNGEMLITRTRQECVCLAATVLLLTGISFAGFLIVCMSDVKFAPGFSGLSCNSRLRYGKNRT